MKRKVTCFTSMALAVLMAVSPVAGSSVSVFAAEPSDDTTAIQVTPTEDSSDEIVVESDSDAIEVKKEMQAAVKIGDAGESDIEMETEYQAGDSIPVHVTAENPTDKAADFHLYFWDYSETLPEDKAGWSEVLTDACEDVKVAELQDTDEYAVDLKQGEDNVQSKASFVSDKDDKDQLTAVYLSMEIPAEASLDTVFHISSDATETVTVVPAFDTESENLFYGDAAAAQWKENSIVVEADQSEDTAETEPDTEDTDEIVVETEEPADSFLSIYVGDSSAETETEEPVVDAEAETDANAETETDTDTESEVSVEAETEEDDSVAVTPDTADLNASDFASMRLVVLADDASVITNDSDVIGQYDNVYLLQFTSIQQAMNAYTYYKDKVTAVEPDATVETAAETESVRTADIAMTEDENPVAMLNEVEASEEVQDAHGVIALIDTGVSESENVIDRVSVIDDVLEGNGHGDEMVKAIVSQDAEAEILSIRAMDDNGFGTISSLVAAMEYAIEQKVDIINLSLYAKSTLMTSVLKEEILKATDAGILVVGSAGNDGQDVAGYMPGAVEEAYIIGAANEDGSRLEISNFGATVDYNVVAGSTSEAAALFTGYVSANGIDAVGGVLNQGLIYATDYNVVVDEPEISGEDLSGYQVDESKSIIVKYLYVNADAISEEDTIDSVFDKIFAEEPYDFSKYIVGDGSDETVELYDTGDGVYKFKADAPLRAGYMTTDQYQDAVFAYGTNEGEIVTSGVSFDKATGVATIEASAFRDNPDDFADMQLQLLVPVHTENGVMTVDQTIEVTNFDGSHYEKQSSVSAFGTEQIPLAVEGTDEMLTSDDFAVYVNDNQLPSDAAWDNDSHTLTIGAQTDTVSDIRIEILKDTDAIFQVANAGPGTTPLFYLPEGTDVSYLKTLPEYTDPECSKDDPIRDTWAAMYKIGYPVSPEPSVIIGTMPDGIDGFDGGETLGGIGLYKGLFGITDANGNPGFICCTKDGTPYGDWSTSIETLTTHNAGIQTGCVHIGSGKEWAPNTRLNMYYKITSWWQGDASRGEDPDYTYFAMYCYGQRKLNAAALGQTAGGSFVFAVKDMPPSGKLQLQKISARPDVTNGNGHYSLGGAKYGVYSDVNCYTLVGTLTTGNNGWSEIIEVQEGTYYVKELSAPAGFKMDTQVYSVTVTTGNSDSPAIVTVSDEPYMVPMHIVKVSSNTNITNGNNSYSLAGATYGVYHDYDCTRLAGTLTTGSDGISNTIELQFGTFYVKEINAPTGFKIDTNIYTIKPNESYVNTTYILNLSDEPYQSQLQIIKTSSNPSVSNGNSNYSLKGAEYTVYKDSGCKTSVGKLITDDKGVSGILTLPLGTYYVKETKAPAGFVIDNKVHTVNLTTAYVNNPYKLQLQDKPETGKAKLLKKSALPNITDGNKCYSLAGAVYGVYKDYSCKQQVGELTTDASGNTNTLELPLGTYYIKEKTPSKGYELDTKVYTIKSEYNKTATVTSTEVPGNDPTNIEITKIWNGPETDTIPTLEGTQFTIKYYDGYYTKDNLPSTPKRTWVLEVKKDKNTGKFITGLADAYLVDGSDEFYRDGSGLVCLPYGTITIQETKPAAGYTLDGYLTDKDGKTISTDSEIYVAQINKDSGAVRLQGGNEFTGYNTPVPGKITLKKFDSDGKTPLAGVTFQCVGETVEDVYTATTDSNGKVVFDNLYPDVYTITETATVDGHTLLKEPIVVEVPMRVDEDYINKFNVDKDSVTYDPADDIYYIHEFTYEITNDVTFKMPMSGGFATPMTFVPLIAGMGILGGLGVVGFRKKRKK